MKAYEKLSAHGAKITKFCYVGVDSDCYNCKNALMIQYKNITHVTIVAADIRVCRPVLLALRLRAAFVDLLWWNNGGWLMCYNELVFN